MQHQQALERLLSAAYGVLASAQNGELFAEEETAQASACAALDELEAAADSAREAL